jgi:hypothetical protein
VACDVFSIILHGVAVEASNFAWGRFYQPEAVNTTVKTLHNNVNVRQFACATNRILAGGDPPWNTTNTDDDFEMK